MNAPNLYAEVISNTEFIRYVHLSERDKFIEVFVIVLMFYWRGDRYVTRKFALARSCFKFLEDWSVPVRGPHLIHDAREYYRSVDIMRFPFYISIFLEYWNIKVTFEQERNRPNSDFFHLCRTERFWMEKFISRNTWALVPVYFEGSDAGYDADTEDN